jgi:signal transduction histidine kinase
MQSGAPQTGDSVSKHSESTPEEQYKAYATYFHTLRNAHNRVVLGLDVLLNKPMDDAERQQRLGKLQDAARAITELLDQAPIPRAR